MFKVSFRGIQVLLSETAALSGQSTPPFKHGFRAEYAGKVPDNPRELWGLVMFDDSDEVKFQIKGLYSDNNEKPKVGLNEALLPCHTIHYNLQSAGQASKELLQIRFSSVDAPKLLAWLKKWPFGTKKDGFGLPKTMLPLSAEPYGQKLTLPLILQL